MKRPPTWTTVGIIAAVALPIVVIMYNRSSTASGNAEDTRSVALSCTTEAAAKYHYHATLTVYINDEQQTIPANTGVKTTCMNPIHTHDATGLVHVESPVERDFTLGDFFAVWDEPFNSSQILNQTVDATHRVRMTVNGQESTEFENLVLADDQEIIIYYEEI